MVFRVKGTGRRASFCTGVEGTFRGSFFLKSWTSGADALDPTGSGFPLLWAYFRRVFWTPKCTGSRPRSVVLSFLSPAGGFNPVERKQSNPAASSATHWAFKRLFGTQFVSGQEGPPCQLLSFPQHPAGRPPTRRGLPLTAGPQTQSGGRRWRR